jgi:lipopolysaccharide export LptBFGC system permease protein LptF
VGAAVRRLLERCLGTYLQYLMPVAAFTGAFFCIARALRSGEAVALKAGGISPLVAWLPLALLALALAGVHALALETLGVRAAGALARAQDPAGGDVRVRGGGIWYHAGRVIYRAQRVDERSGAARDVRVYERDGEGRLLRTIAAESAERLSPQRWRFERVRVVELDPADPDAPARERKADELMLTLAEDRSPRLSLRELGGLPLPSLRAYVDAALAAGDDPGAARVVLHNRLTAPLLVPLFALLAAALAGAADPARGLARAALVGGALLVVLLLARDYGTGFAARGGPAAAWFPWLTLGGFSLVCAACLRRVPR